MELAKETRADVNEFYQTYGDRTPEQIQQSIKSTCHIGKIKDCKYHKNRDGMFICIRGWCLAK